MCGVGLVLEHQPKEREHRKMDKLKVKLPIILALALALALQVPSLCPQPLCHGQLGALHTPLWE